MNIDHTADLATWLSQTFPGTQCPPLPKKRGDLVLTAEIALQLMPLHFSKTSSLMGGWGQDLCLQTLWRVGIADSSCRRTSLISVRPVWSGKRKSFSREFSARWISVLLIHLALQKRNRQSDQAVQELIAETSHDRWARMLSNPPSPQAIAAARAAWGVTGD